MENNRIGELLQRGIESHKNRQYAEAESCYREVLATSPNNADAIHLLGLLADSIGDKELAIDLIRSAIASTSGVFYGNLARILKFKGETDLAIACYMEAIKLNPRYAEACFNLANLYRDLEKSDDAVLLYRQAIAIIPDLDIAWTNLAEMLHKLGQLDDAISCYQHSLELKPEDTFCKKRLADALFERGQEFGRSGLHDQATVGFEDYLSALPADTSSHHAHDFLKTRYIPPCTLPNSALRRPVCHQKTRQFDPLSESSKENLRKYRRTYSLDDYEMLNYGVYSCPHCGASDRDRLYALYISKYLKGHEGPNPFLLDIAPSQPLSAFLGGTQRVMRRTADLIEYSNQEDGGL